MIAYLFHDYGSALAFANVAREYVVCILASYTHPIFLFYDSLISLEMAKTNIQETNQDKQKWMKNAQDNLLKLKHMSQHAPQNYANKIHLIEAEMNLVLGKKLEVFSYYQKAISLSKENDFPNEEALA